MKFFGQRGVTLVELMLALAIGGGVALLGSKLMSDQVTNQNYVSMMSDINRMTALAQQNLAVKDACDKTFSIFQANTNFSSGQLLPAVLNSKGTAIIKTGDYKRFTLKMTVEDSPVSKNLKQVNLLYSYPPSSILPNKKTVKTEIKIFMHIEGNKSGTGYLSTDKWKCGEVFIDSKTLAWEKLCADLGTSFATWDNVTKACKIKQFKCPYGQVPTSLNKLGELTCKPAVQGLDLGQMIDTSTVPCPLGQRDFVKIHVVNGKFTISCSQFPTM